MTPPRLDRTGRILVRIGSLVAVVFVALPAFVFALFILGFADSSTSFLGQFFVAALLVVTLAVVVTVVMMLRGSTVWLALGGIGGLVAGSIALVLVYQRGDAVVASLGQAALVASSAFMLALGAALRLISRRRT
jgi:hypothetical protein